jgi:membrane protein involved in colicin uptake
MKKLIKIKDNKGLLRDPETNAVIVDDRSSYKNYLRLKQQKQVDNNRIEKIEEEVNNIKNDIGEIKELLFALFKNET